MISILGIVSIVAIGISVAFLIQFHKLMKYRKPLDMAMHQLHQLLDQREIYLEDIGFAEEDSMEDVGALEEMLKTLQGEIGQATTEYYQRLTAYNQYVAMPPGSITAAILGLGPEAEAANTAVAMDPEEMHSEEMHSKEMHSKEMRSDEISLEEVKEVT